jgi:RNA polymerase sigma-70 factor (ECF subfamily)
MVPDLAKALATDDDLDRLLRELRPKLHRYCARMTGSVIDGEDVVQQALAKAVEARGGGMVVVNPEAWLFRIAHNAALDFLRRRARHAGEFSIEDAEMIPDDRDAASERIAAAAGMRSFMGLSAAQRAAVVLRDVLGYSLEDIVGILGTTIASVKASLHRGRARLRELVDEPDDRPLPALDPAQRSLLQAYVDRFNARDFDAIRDLLADEVRLELVARTRMHGKREVGTYLGNYERASDWKLTIGYVEGQAAIVVSDPREPRSTPSYLILLDWQEGRLLAIRDFRYARYILEGADIVPLD